MKSLIAFVLSISIASISFAYSHQEHAEKTRLKFSDGAIHVYATWLQGPHSPEESILRLEWKNSATHSLMEPPGNIKVVLWMPGMGHGSSPTRVEQVLDSNGQPLLGVYQVSRIYFTMGGKWDAHVILQYEDGTEETDTIKIELHGHGGHHH